MESNTSKIWLIIVLVVVVGGAFYWLGSESDSSNPTIDVETNTKVAATTVQVGTFYDGKDGYSLSIPSGNSSTCIWNYTGGNAAIPYSETTYARSATEKHTIYSYDYYDWKVNCLDDFGNQYVGVFPQQ